ncbi:CPBP family intramembrane glutamic endopeptidase [Intestinimonas butyriciproducens]|uniref:CPBP family intramembrane glutamic endopeptidase n=1 Tax=Intestinimonas butyriciproducens TaxID=1297617 RepID=UPI00195E14FC|nr:CPBP family intramembrane glutamic endopeptidase [Intestinimonas butyriciproducens]MBM6918460.1 CPBP family intramembrane metalloprotease [Intestinimonas butyriciproducens]
MNRKKIITYIVITFAITYTFWWGLALLTNRNILHSSQGLFTLLFAIGGFGPTISAILLLPEKGPKPVLRFIFSCQKNSFWYLLLFCVIQAAVIGLSSMELNPQLPWYTAPVVLLSATLVSGGNEELGWRGTMQPELEKKFPFPVAALITGCVWMMWHIPLWFIEGMSHQNIHFGLYCIYGLILSFWLAVLYQKTASVFCCAIFHGFSNLMLSMFVIKANWILAVGLIAALVSSIWLFYQNGKPKIITK